MAVVFSREWFALHQGTLVWLLNTRMTRRWRCFIRPLPYFAFTYPRLLLPPCVRALSKEGKKQRIFGALIGDRK